MSGLESGVVAEDEDGDRVIRRGLSGKLHLEVHDDASSRESDFPLAEDNVARTANRGAPVEVVGEPLPNRIPRRLPCGDAL